MSTADLPEPDHIVHTHEECGDLKFWNETSVRAYGDKRAREAVEALADEVRAYLEAQDALDNWELQGPNREQYDKVMRRRNLASNSLRAILDAFPAASPSPDMLEKR